MSGINWDTQHGRAFLDLALCRVGSAGPGDVLVIRYGGCADRVDALKFMEALVDAGSKMPAGTIKNPVHLVVAPEGVNWAFAATGKAADENGPPGPPATATIGK